MRRATLSLLALLLATAALGQDCPAQHLDDVLSPIDAVRLKATVDKLAAFGTRHTLSDTTSSTRGIGAARRWIFDEMSHLAADSGGRGGRPGPAALPPPARPPNKPPATIQN